MKIVHILHHYWPVIGGIENAVKALAEEQIRFGHEVHIVTSPYGAQGRPREEEINGVYVHRVKAIRLGSPELTLPLEYPNIFRNADVVHGHSHNSLFVVKMIEHAKRRYNIKTAMYFMAVDSLHSHPNPLFRRFGPMYAESNLKKAIKIADIKLVMSIRDMRILEKKYGVTDIVYMPLGVSESIMSAPNMAEKFRKKYGIIDPFVVYVGRLHQLKGIHILIKAMSIVIKEIKDAKAVIVGPGDQKPYKQLAERLNLSNAVLFLGYLDEDDKIAALDASTALVLPSVSDFVEAFSIVTSEAWARHRPVIASAVGELLYRVRHMEDGILVPPRDPKALASAIVLLLSDKELAKKLGAKGREKLKLWREIAQEILGLYAKRESINPDDSAL